MRESAPLKIELNSFDAVVHGKRLPPQAEPENEDAATRQPQRALPFSKFKRQQNMYLLDFVHGLVFLILMEKRNETE